MSGIIDAVERIGDDIEHIFTKGDDLPDAFKQLFEEVYSGTLEAVQKVEELADKIEHGFTNLKFLGPAFGGIGAGITEGGKRSWETTSTFFTDFQNVCKEYWNLMTAYFEFMKKIMPNFLTCLFFYLLDFITYFCSNTFWSFLIFLEMQLEIRRYTKFGLTDSFHVVADYWQQGDDFCHLKTGYRYTQWPESIQNMCYNCSADSTAATKAAALFRTNYNAAPKKFTKTYDIFNLVGKNFRSAFSGF
jgi:hypothetical protein